MDPLAVKQAELERLQELHKSSAALVSFLEDSAGRFKALNEGSASECWLPIWPIWPRRHRSV